MERTLLRINLENKEVLIEDFPDKLKKLGGRALTSTIISDEIEADVEPLSKENKIVFATGLLTGINASSVHRLSCGSLSPLTGGIKESNSGGIFALHMALSSIGAIILENELDQLSIIKIDGTSVEVINAEDYKGLRTIETGNKLRQQFGNNISYICIGPAGENRLLASSIVVSDVDGTASRHLGRGGLGAVMGSKKVKAIVIPKKKGYLKGKNLNDLRENVKEYLKLLSTTKQTSEIYTLYGTAAMVDTTNALNGMPTNNFRFGSHKDAENINGLKLNKVLNSRGGDVSHGCMPGCTIRCSNIYNDINGNELVRSLEYETIVLCGSNLGIFDLDKIAVINSEINNLGLDSIDIGGAIGVLMDMGRLDFGDYDGVLKVLDEIENDTVLGRLIGSGTKKTGQILGSPRIPAVKGQGLPGYDPRAVKGHGVTFATTSMGADHTAGMTIREGLDPNSNDGQVESSLKMQKMAVIYDSLGLCLFTHVAVKNNLELISEILSNFYGVEWNQDDMFKMAEKILILERKFNRERGLVSSYDKLPKMFTNEYLGEKKSIFDIPKNDLDKIYDSIEI